MKKIKEKSEKRRRKQKENTMARRRSTKITNRAWRLLHIAILWARKGSVFKLNRVFLQVRQLHLLKTLKLKQSRQSDRRYCAEREFSFDETPAFKFKTPSLRFLPCIAPDVDNDYDQDEVDFLFYKHDKECDNLIEYEKYEYDEREDESVDLIEESEENGIAIDQKAEQFITRFHEEMKLQRQMSAIQYYEMLERSV
ncbi:hypothetical protein LUZ60_003695 [Juncus effusus]|nr:hypothetical protein LUZ60_003695 [Juncus effusus]